MSDPDDIPGSSNLPYRTRIPPRSRVAPRKTPPPVQPRMARAPNDDDEVKKSEGTQSEPTARRLSRARTSYISLPDASRLMDKKVPSAYHLREPEDEAPAKPQSKTGRLITFLRGKSTEPDESETDPDQMARRRQASTSERIGHKASRIMYTTDEEVRDALLEFGVFIIFLVLTTLVTLSVRHEYMFYFNDTIQKLLSKREMVIKPSVTLSFEKLITVVDFWDFLEYNFLVTLHGDMTSVNLEEGEHHHDEDDNRGKTQETEAGDPPPKPPNTGKKRKKREDREDKEDKEEKHTVDGHRNETHLEGRVFLHENLMMGPPRLRQIRVRKNTCFVNDAFIRYFNACYAEYSKSAEEITNSHGGAPYRTMTELAAKPLWAKLNSYSSGGYTVDLTFNKQKNMEEILKLKEAHWLDRGSRLVLIEFNLYNMNTEILQSVKIIAEIPPTGGVLPQCQLQTVKEFTFFTERRLGMSVVYIFWYIMVLYYNIHEINQMRRTGFINYFRSVINILDLLILLFCYLALCYNIWHTHEMKRIMSHAKLEQSYLSLDTLCFWNMLYVDMMAILAFIVWIKIFKFISFNKTLVQFTTTLRRCSKDLAGFSLMFGIVFLAYAQLGLLLFGTKHPDFRDFVTSILTMIRMILGDFQYNLIEDANRVLGPIYFLTYILLVFFILLNMFLAIIMETYNTVKSEITQGRSQLGSYIFKKIKSLIYYITHCGRKRPVQHEPQRRRQTDENEFETDDTAPATHYQSPKIQLRRNMTEAEAHYFEDVPDDVRNKDMFRLNNRVSLLEEILEQLVTNMDSILKRVEKEIKKHS